MSISQNSPNTQLHEPVPGERVPADTRDYLRARAKRQAYDLVMRELNAAGITRAELARRLGKGADRVSKMLGGPSNWTIITLADLLFAIGGGVPKYAVDFPLKKPARNLGSRDLFFELKRKDAQPTSNEQPITIKLVPQNMEEAA